MKSRSKLIHKWFSLFRNFTIITFLILGLTGIIRSAEGTSLIDQQIALFKDKDVLNDQKAIDVLVKIGVPALNKLIPILPNAKRDMKAGIIEALGRIGDPRAYTPLLLELKKVKLTRQKAETFANSYIRIMLIKALGDLGDKQAIPILLQIMRSQDIYEHTHAIVSLDKLGYEGINTQLVEVAAGNDANCRNIVVMAVGRRGNKKMIPMLKNALLDKVWFIRASAIDSLANIADTSVIPDIDKMLKDKSPYVRQAANDALNKLRNKQSP